MGKQIDFTGLGGMPLTQQELGYMQDTYMEGFRAFAKMTGVNSFIVSGMEDNGTDISAGYIYHDGRIIPFTQYLGGGVRPTHVSVVTSTETLLYGGVTPRNTITTYAAELSNANPTILYSDLRRFQHYIGSGGFGAWKTIGAVPGMSYGGTFTGSLRINHLGRYAHISANFGSLNPSLIPSNGIWYQMASPDFEGMNTLQLGNTALLMAPLSFVDSIAEKSLTSSSGEVIVAIPVKIAAGVFRVYLPKVHSSHSMYIASINAMVPLI